MGEAASGPTGRDGPHAFVDDLDALELRPEDEHHLTRVLRLRPGDPLTVSDGAGSWRSCRFAAPLEPTGPIQRVERPRPPITIGFALAKGERPEMTVQKLTELGVDRLLPFAAARSVVRWDEARAAKATARWRRIAREAAMQSRRVWLPDVGAVATFADVAGIEGAVRAEPTGRPLSLRTPTVLVGPEGGWADDERATLEEVALGRHVLRTDTAAIVAAALLGALRAGVVAP